MYIYIYIYIYIYTWIYIYTNIHVEILKSQLLVPLTMQNDCNADFDNIL